MLKKGGFTLRKWSSNHPALLKHLPPENVEDKMLLSFGNEELIKTLGLLWNPTTDKLIFHVQLTQDAKPTKRSVLRAIASIYDPLGLLSPVVIQCKIFMQHLWQLKVNWDDPLTAEMRDHWEEIQHKLPVIQSIQMDRLVISKERPDRIEMHGFSDASEEAYGACIYIRSIDAQGKITSKLLCAKSRVAPLKKLSLPRLELSAAMLLADIYHTSSKALKISFNKINLWTDSMVVLAWLRSPPSRWKTFVANRVSHIQELTNIENWNHVSSKENPADLVSRGVDANMLRNLRLWWNGPSWLQQEETVWPKQQELIPSSEEQRTVRPLTAVSLLTQPCQWEMFTKFSSWRKLQRVTAYCLRFIHNCKNKTTPQYGVLSPSELSEATLVCVKHAQTSCFQKELIALTGNGTLSNKSSLLSLNPFIDGRQLLRVGGRLEHSDLTFDQRHPIILPRSHFITTLIIEDTHKENMHASGQLLLSLIRQKYWIPGARNVLKKVTQKCVHCLSLKATTATQLMGQLPEVRVRPSKPFTNTGVDYSGPFYIKQGSKRSKTLNKCYVALFVCLSTKAIQRN